MIQKIKRLFIMAFCMIFLMGITVKANGNTEFHVENQTGKEGDIVTVPIQFNTGQEVGGFQISIYYDNEVMEFDSLEQGDLIIENAENGGGIFDYNHIEESAEIIVVYVVADTVKDEGVIVNINFKLKQDCGQELPIGMGVDQLIDGSESSSPLTGTVSGVDEAFQEKIMQQRENNTTTVVASGDTSEEKGSDGDADESGSSDQTGSDEPTETAENGTEKSESNENTDGADSDSTSREVNADKNTDRSRGLVPAIIGGAVFIIVAVIAVIVIVIARKRSSTGRKK